MAVGSSRYHSNGQDGRRTRLTSTNSAAPTTARRDGKASHSAVPTVGLHARRKPHDGNRPAPVMTVAHCDMRTLYRKAGLRTANHAKRCFRCSEMPHAKSITPNPTNAGSGAGETA